eukprot:TRINITY_DN32151_c0_g1_i1.p1 TRINITY_DN32151_c0_g1~~TRINITY_DN32151_c0_g1_i1.p1  ORF type:complete len:407 (+),score=76.96 TRINITY_DN32151_c0_g1_i1:73-1221(+)
MAPASASSPPSSPARSPGSATAAAEEREDLLESARRALAAAEAAHKAASVDAPTPAVAVSVATRKAVEELCSLVDALQQSPSGMYKRKQRQSFSDFATLLGEEMKEAAEEQVVEVKRKAERTLRKAKSLIEDHFHIDEAFRMLGPLAQDDNRARDVHDWFNLVALLPVIFFDVINWGCPDGSCASLFSGNMLANFPRFWHGQAFETFWWTTFAYFVLDLGWMVLLPNCVRSPDVIIKHHVATIGYIFIPKLRPRYAWLMGACMIVEVNTWFLIARRSFNKLGDKPFAVGVTHAKSLRLLVVSSFFYLTWLLIRLVIYPFLLCVIIREWYLYSIEVGTPLNLIALCPALQCVFIFLNVKWTIDLVRSKLKSRPDGKSGPAKGL